MVICSAKDFGCDESINYRSHYTVLVEFCYTSLIVVQCLVFCVLLFVVSILYIFNLVLLNN